MYQAAAIVSALAALGSADALLGGPQSASLRNSMASGIGQQHGLNAASSHGKMPFSMRALLDAQDGPVPDQETVAAAPGGVVDDIDGDGDDDGGEEDFGADDDVAPAPPSVGADVPVTYFGPAPSDFMKELIGPFQLLRSGVLDQENGTITLPLYRGFVEEPEEGAGGTTGYMYYVVTDTTDISNGNALGLNISPKLFYANVGRGARSAYLDTDLTVRFRGGAVDFTPAQEVVPGTGESVFPPDVATPGSVGDEFYSPYFALENSGGNVYNGPIVSMGATVEQLREYCDGIPEDKLEEARTLVHDKVIAICPEESGVGGTVTLELAPGFSFAKPVFYLSLDASDETAAALEASTFAPGMQDIQTGADDSLYSAVERIFVTINGYTNADVNPQGLEDGPGEVSHPSRQGLVSVLSGDPGGPLNVLGGIPTVATDYSPAWDVNFGEWTEYAVANGYRDRLTEEFQILGLVLRGFITGPGGAPYGSSGPIVNCPIVFRFL